MTEPTARAVPGWLAGGVGLRYGTFTCAGVKLLTSTGRANVTTKPSNSREPSLAKLLLYVIVFLMTLPGLLGSGASIWAVKSLTTEPMSLVMMRGPAAMRR